MYVSLGVCCLLLLLVLVPLLNCGLLVLLPAVVVHAVGVCCTALAVRLSVGCLLLLVCLDAGC